MAWRSFNLALATGLLLATAAQAETAKPVHKTAHHAPVKKPRPAKETLKETQPGLPGDSVPDHYADLKNDFQAKEDSCDLINARDILELNTLPIATLRSRKADIAPLFKETLSRREKCYTQAKLLLKKLMLNGHAYAKKHPDDTTFARQLEMDSSLADMLDIRIHIAKKLLASMQADIDAALAQAYPPDTEEKTYYKESALTHALVRSDMDLVLEVERRQLVLDENTLVTTPHFTPKQWTELKLRQINHDLSEALLVYEDAAAGSPIFAAARLQTAFDRVADEFAELFAYSPTLEGVDTDAARRVAQLGDRAQVIQLDISGAVRDLRTKQFKENYDNWLSEVYQELSQMAIDTRAALGMVQGKIKPPAPEAEKPTTTPAPKK